MTSSIEVRTSRMMTPEVTRAIEAAGRTSCASEPLPFARKSRKVKENSRMKNFQQLRMGRIHGVECAQLKPFINGRADIFVYNGVFDDFRRATTIKDPFNILDKYKIDYVFLQPSQPLSYLLEHSPAWHAIYTDKVAVLFERTPATAAAATPLKVQSN